MNLETHCPYYAQGLYIGSTPAGLTEISMCCWQKKQQVSQVSFDHPYLVDAREQSKKTIPSTCSTYCNQPEHELNERKRSYIDWNQFISDDTEELGIKALHLEQSLTCNLKCISCSSKYSSAWNGEYQLFDPSAPQISLKKEPESVWKDLDLTQLRRLHFTGGEPLLNKDNKKILQHLDKLGVLSNVVLSYNTNGTVLPDTEVLELWQRSRFVRLFFSLDGVGSTFEYTRFPAKWSDVEQNIQYFRSLNRICILIEVNPVIGVHNIFNLPKIFQWWEEHCQTGSQGDPSQIILRYIEPSSFGGQVLSLKHLTNFQANAALDMLQLLTRYTGVQDLINYIKQNRSPDNCWMDYLNKLDSIRNTDWHTALQIQKEATC